MGTTGERGRSAPTVALSFPGGEEAHFAGAPGPGRFDTPSFARSGFTLLVVDEQTGVGIPGLG